MLRDSRVVTSSARRERIVGWVRRPVAGFLGFARNDRRTSQDLALYFAPRESFERTILRGVVELQRVNSRRWIGSLPLNRATDCFVALDRFPIAELRANPRRVSHPMLIQIPRYAQMRGHAIVWQNHEFTAPLRHGSDSSRPFDFRKILWLTNVVNLTGGSVRYRRERNGRCEILDTSAR